MPEFCMPSLGADMERGRLIEWCVRPGATVHAGQVLAVVETHKGAIDVEGFVDGVIEELVPLGSELPVGARLAWVRAPGEAAPEPPAPRAPRPIPPAAAPTREVLAAAASPAMPGARVRVSPAARRRAQQLGLDPGALAGSGGDGAVVLADVERAEGERAEGERAAAAPRRGFDPVQMRAAIASAMARSKREIPHYHLVQTLDFGPAQDWLDAWNAAHEPEQRLLPAVLLLKASARALAAFPSFNGWFEQGQFRAADGVQLGWAIALRGGGLIAPAIHHAERLDLPELMAALRDLVQRARAGGLRSSELSDASCTVTSLGERGADGVLGVIYPPQVALLGFGRVALRPWVVGAAVQARALVQASLAADHRVSDGHLGGQLLAAIAAALLDPATL